MFTLTRKLINSTKEKLTNVDPVDISLSFCFVGRWSVASWLMWSVVSSFITPEDMNIVSQFQFQKHM